jgi:hypothetical protein
VRKRRTARLRARRNVACSKKDGVATISARTHTRVAVENAAPGGAAPAARAALGAARAALGAAPATAAPDVAVNLETYSYLAQIIICAPIRNTFHILLLLPL